MAILIGEITHIVCAKESWAAFKLREEHGGTYSCSGKIIGVTLNTRMKLEGEFITHPIYGEQFNFTSYELLVGGSLSDIERYLTSNAISGIGEKLAHRIIEAFGTDTIDVIRNDPEKLATVKGISKKKAQKIHESEANSQVFQILLSYANLTPKQAITLYEHYKENTVKIIKKTPYKIIFDVDGFGFKTVDKIARKNGVKENDPDRLAAAITYCLVKIGDDGHCYTTLPRLQSALEDLLPNVSMEEIANALAKEIANERVIQEGSNIYAKRLYDAELYISESIASLLSKPCKAAKKTLIDDVISDFEDDTGFHLEEQQKNAVYAALQNNIAVITGGPGTGKSSILNVIVKAWTSFKNKDKPEECVCLCAPTGKAARRAADLTHCPAETAQKMTLKWVQNKDDSFYKGKLLIVDESSMIDIYLAHRIMEMVVTNNMRVVFVGDTYQLPPIGPGNFFKDLCDSVCVPSVTLRLCFRQHGTIAINAKRINEGAKFASLNFEDITCRFKFAEKDDAREAVISEYLALVDEYGVQNVSCIVPMRKKGRSHTASEDLNEIIRAKLNPPTMLTENEKIKFRVGDRVMQTTNDYDRDVFNGDCGVVWEIDDFNEVVSVLLDNGKVIEYNYLQCSELIFAYAITVHRSQGSEYKGVVIAHNREHSIMLERNLLYTAITRAKEKVVIVGEPAAINIATSKMSSHERMRALKKKIGEELVRAKHHST